MMMMKVMKAWENLFEVLRGRKDFALAVRCKKIPDLIKVILKHSQISDTGATMINKITCSNISRYIFSLVFTKRKKIPS